MNKEIYTEIISEGDSVPMVTAPPQGWDGDSVTCVRVNGHPHRITIVRNGEFVLSLRIGEDGNITLTNYQGSFQIAPTNQLDLSQSRSWLESK